MPHAEWTKIIHTDKARGKDDDIAKGLNLVFPVVSEIFSYPEVNYPADSTTVKPKVIYLGDSYLFTWMYDYFMDNTNTDWQIWYYGHYLYDRNNRNEQQLHWIENDYWLNAIKTTDCLVIMYTSRNLPELGDGFIEKAYDYYYPKK